MSVEEGRKNAFERLCDDLDSGKITLLMIDIAVMKWIQKSKVIPEGAKNLLVEPAGGGLVRKLFFQIRQTIGTIELCYRRGMMEGKGEYETQNEKQ